MTKRDHVPKAVLRRSPPLQRKRLARARPTGKRATTVPADEWLNHLIHKSPAFQMKVAEGLAAINVAQDLG